jgi:hypothetical protein
MQAIRVLGLVVAGLLMGLTAAARGLVVTPVQLGLVGRAGSAVSDVIMVASSREEPVQVRVRISDFIKDEDGRLREVPHEQVPRSCAGWLQVDQENLTAPGTGRAEVRVSARIPADAEGSYWAVVGLEVPAVPREGGKGARIFIVPRVAVPVIVTVEGTEKRQLAVTRVEAKRTEGELVTCQATIENTGNVAVLVSGAFALEAPPSKQGEEPLEVASADVGPLTSLPGNKLRITGKLNWAGTLAGFTVHSYLRWGPGAQETSEASTSVEEEAPPVGGTPAIPAGKLLPAPPFPTRAPAKP